MYDWANSGYATSGLAAFFPVYYVLLFKDALGEEAVLWGINFTGSSSWSVGLAISTLVVAISSPILGVIADRIPIKKILLWAYTIAGSLFAVLGFFSAYTSHPWAWLLGTFILGNIGFAGGLVIYNSFLPHIAPRHLLDEVSSRGYAFGYVGGGLLLLGHVVVLVLTSQSDHSDLILRLCIASVGLWWFGWSLWALKAIPEPVIFNKIEGLTISRAPRVALSELSKTFKELVQFKVILIYLAAYLLFNDGIQTVMGIATAFATDALKIDQMFIILSLLIIQFVAAPSAMGFSKLASIWNTKKSLYIALAGWIVIVLFGVAIIPLEPNKYGDFDYQLTYNDVKADYLLENLPDLSNSKLDTDWDIEIGDLELGQSLSVTATKTLVEKIDISDNSQYSVSISGGVLDGITHIGRYHKSKLGYGALDWWPELIRNSLWIPLGLTAELQWIILGISVGLVMGGSQALARSLFAQITPETRSGEFFSFFGFMSRASSVFGPMLYVVVTAMFDTRVAVASILSIIIAGTSILKWVDVEKGVIVAQDEDQKQRANS